MRSLGSDQSFRYYIQVLEHLSLRCLTSQGNISTWIFWPILCSQRVSFVINASVLLRRQILRWYDGVPLERALDVSSVLWATGFVALKEFHCLRSLRACCGLTTLTNLWIRNMGSMLQKIGFFLISSMYTFSDFVSKKTGGHGRCTLPISVE